MLFQALQAEQIHLMPLHAAQSGHLAGTGFIDIDHLHSLARKRPSSRWDHVFPSPAGFGPFFTAFVYNERLCFYTFKVCYMWSAPDVENGEPQYAELIEMQMTPREMEQRIGKGQKALLSEAFSALKAEPGFELRVAAEKVGKDAAALSSEGSESSDVDEDSNKAKIEMADHFSLRFSSNIHQPMRETKAERKKNQGGKRGDRETMRGRVCLEDPSRLAQGSKRALMNRVARGCCKDDDWEKVGTDERRLEWLRGVCEAGGLKQLGVSAEAQETTRSHCNEALQIRCIPAEK